MHIGERLKKARQAKHYTLKDLSARTRISPSYISDIENNRNLPSIETLLQLCEALDVKCYMLFWEEALGHQDPEDAYFEELHALLSDFPNWDLQDKKELLSYLAIKQSRKDCVRK